LNWLNLFVDMHNVMFLEYNQQNHHNYFTASNNKIFVLLLKYCSFN